MPGIEVTPIVAAERDFRVGLGIPLVERDIKWWMQHRFHCIAHHFGTRNPSSRCLFVQLLDLLNFELDHDGAKSHRTIIVLGLPRTSMTPLFEASVSRSRPRRTTVYVTRTPTLAWRSAFRRRWSRSASDMRTSLSRLSSTPTSFQGCRPKPRG